MSQTNDPTEKESTEAVKAPDKTKLVLPDGDSPDVTIGELILADVVEEVDGTEFILLLASGGRHFFLSATGPNIAALEAVISVNRTKREVFKSAGLEKKLSEIKASLSGQDPVPDIAAELVFDDGNKIVAIICCGEIFYFDYDSTAKNALSQQGVRLNLALGGSAKVNLEPG